MQSIGNKRLGGRRIVITGAASGIGRATAALFIAEGAKVALLDIDESGAAQSLGSASGASFGVDVSDALAMTAAIDSVGHALGGIDGLVAAAGIMRSGPTGDFSLTDWQRVIGVNLTGAFNAAKACLPHLRATSGASIVTIASATGLLPNAAGMVGYAASKGGLIAMTKALAADLAPEIRANCICPGLVDTPMGEGFLGNVDRYALGRAADPIEIARAALFLVSDEASYVTGAALAVDGGRSFH